MILSCCRRAYSPRVKSPRRAGVAGGVGEVEVVPAGGVLVGDATPLSEDTSLKKRATRLLLHELDQFTNISMQVLHICMQKTV